MSNTPGLFTIVNEIDGMVVRELMDKPEFLDRVEAVLLANGSPPEVAPSSARIFRAQIAACPDVYWLYHPNRLVSDITDTAIRVGITWNSYMSAATPTGTFPGTPQS